MAAIELQRQRIIERNRARLAELGVLDAAEEAQAVKSKQPKKESTPTQERAQKGSKGSQGRERQPTRRSRRIQNEPPELESERERPTRPVPRGKEEDEGDEEGERKKRKAQRTTKPWKERIKEVELGGLVRMDEGEAEFVIVGSTGRPYTVILGGDNGRQCTCPDFRIRKRDCKHIGKLLGSIGAESDPSQWRSCLNAKLSDLSRYE